MKSLDDNEIVKHIQVSTNQNLIRKYQEELYRRFVKQIYAKCLAIVRNKQIAQDLAHDIFIKIFINLNSFKGDAPFGSWVNSITYNHSINYLKKVKKLRTTADVNIIEQGYSDEDIATLIEKENDYNLLEKAILQLKESDRMILIMKYTDSYSIQEISNKLKTKESATKMRLKRARNNLHNLVKQLKNGSGKQE